MDNYEVICKIGKGAFGVVSKIRRKSDNRILVWKEFDYSNLTDREKHQIITEINILRQLNHPNIVRYHDRLVDKKNTRIYIVMEYCEGGDLADLLKECLNNGDSLPEDVIWKIFFQILLALNACHTHKGGKILHRDLKAANVFIDGTGGVKLGDFGLARIMDEHTQFAYSNVGTPYYMSPEQINHSKYNEKSDVWSAGCLLYEMCAMHPPFQAHNHVGLALKIKAGKFERIPMRYSENLQSLIETMLTINAEDRPSVESLLRQPPFAIWTKEMMLKEKSQILREKEMQIKQRETLTKIQEQMMKKKMQDLVMLEERLKEVERVGKRKEGYRELASGNKDMIAIINAREAGPNANANLGANGIANFKENIGNGKENSINYKETGVSMRENLINIRENIISDVRENLHREGNAHGRDLSSLKERLGMEESVEDGHEEQKENKENLTNIINVANFNNARHDRYMSDQEKARQESLERGRYPYPPGLIEARKGFKRNGPKKIKISVPTGEDYNPALFFKEKMNLNSNVAQKDPEEPASVKGEKRAVSVEQSSKRGLQPRGALMDITNILKNN